MGKKRKNGEGSYGEKTINGYKYKYYKDSNLYLEISAKIDEEKSVTYKVPIKFNNC